MTKKVWRLLVEGESEAVRKLKLYEELVPGLELVEMGIHHDGPATRPKEAKTIHEIHVEQYLDDIGELER